MKKLIIASFLLISFFLSVPLVQSQDKTLSPGEIYDAGIELFLKGRYEEAITRFSKLIQNFPGSRLVPYAHYMMGQSFLKMGKYEEAIQKFEYYLKTYPDGGRVRDSEQGLKMARERLLPRMKRRICAQVSYLDGRNLAEVEKMVKELKDAGVDTLIFRVFHSRGDRMYRFVKAGYEEGVFFQTEHAPVIDDVLGKIAEITRRQGLQLFAWMTTRHATYGIEKHFEYRSRHFNFETKRMEIGRGLNLFHPDVLLRLEGLFRDLGRYPIDGILFQDDLILRHNEDFSGEANKAFLKEFGFVPHPDIFYIDPYPTGDGRYHVKGYTDQFWTWARWKNRYLMEVAERLIKAARESNPKLQFALNLYFEAVLNESNGVAWFSQTLKEAFKKGFDYYAIMAYHRQAMRGRKIEMKESMGLMAEVAQKAVHLVGDPSRVLMKLWILDWKPNEAVGFDLAPPEEIEEILTKVLEQGEVSLAFVPYIHQFPLHQLKGQWSGTKLP